MSRKKTTIGEKKLKKIGERLIKLRESTGLNQPDFGKSIGISQSSVSDLEIGKYPPSKPTLFAIQNQYSITPEEILTGEGFSVKKRRYEVGKSRDIYVRSPGEVPYNIDVLLEDAKKILTSGNQAAIDALERNIRYFSHTIDLETRMVEMEDRIKAIEVKKDISVAATAKKQI